MLVLRMRNGMTGMTRRNKPSIPYGFLSRIPKPVHSWKTWTHRHPLPEGLAPGPSLARLRAPRPPAWTWMDFTSSFRPGAQKSKGGVRTIFHLGPPVLIMSNFVPLGDLVAEILFLLAVDPTKGPSDTITPHFRSFCGTLRAS